MTYRCSPDCYRGIRRYQRGNQRDDQMHPQKRTKRPALRDAFAVGKKATCHDLRLVGNDTYRLSVRTCETDDVFGCVPVCMNLEGIRCYQQRC